MVIAEGKRDDHLLRIVRAYLRASGRVVVSRLEPSRVRVLRGSGGRLRYEAEARTAVLAVDGRRRTRSGGVVAILAAGTSDVPVCEEARVIAEELGCEVLTAYDVGAAGVHRLDPELGKLSRADAVVVAAGREGTLPTLVAGLVDKPVIGLPVGTGYGAGGKGQAALLAMLQSCSPLTVVNVDAGFVAGACAARIANLLARERRRNA